MSGIKRISLEYCRQMMVDFRRDMHRHPEPDFEETRMAAKIAAILQSLGIEGRGGAGAGGSATGGREFPRQASQTMLEIHPAHKRKTESLSVWPQCIDLLISNGRFV